MLFAVVVFAGVGFCALSRAPTGAYTGCELQALSRIGEFVVSPGMSVERINLYCGWVDARTADGVHGLPHEGEEIRVVTLSRTAAVAELFRRLNSTSIIMALQWLELNRDQLLRQWGLV